MYIKFILGQLKLFGMIILSFFMFPFITYPRRKEIWDMKDLPLKKWYWKFSDTSETGFGNDETDNYNYLNSTYGIYELVKKRDANGNWVGDYERFATFSKLRKWFIAYHWLVFRNGCWNYIMTQVPKQGVWENVVCKANYPEEISCREWRDKYIHGTQFVTWEVDGEKQFRYSFTRKTKWYNIQAIFALIFTFKWHNMYNFMIGMSDDRYLLKTRTFNLEDN
tara:strand:- start:388 stop:1053 length:666 start_codon:yes stop_codon:yes gene_type:complete